MKGVIWALFTTGQGHIPVSEILHGVILEDGRRRGGGVSLSPKVLQTRFYLSNIIRKFAQVL